MKRHSVRRSIARSKEALLDSSEARGEGLDCHTDDWGMPRCVHWATPTTTNWRGDERGEILVGASAISADGARVDVAAKGFWGGRYERAFFDIRVFNPHTQSNHGQPFSLKRFLQLLRTPLHYDVIWHASYWRSLLLTFTAMAREWNVLSSISTPKGTQKRIGFNLSRLLQMYGAPLSEDQTWAVCYQCTKSLLEFHNRGIPVPELSVKNVVLSIDGNVYFTPGMKSCNVKVIKWRTVP